MTANPYGSKANDGVCQQEMETDFVIRFEMLRTCDGGVRSRVGCVSSQPQISPGNGVEIFASNGGGCRRIGRGICGKNGGDAVKNLDGRWNGVFVSSIRPWSFGLGCAAAGCESSCSVSYERGSRIGCDCGFDSCVASRMTESRIPHGHGHDHDHDHDHGCGCGYDCPESFWLWTRRSAPCSHDNEVSSLPTRRVGAKMKVCLADCSLGCGLVSGAAALELNLWDGGGAERRSLG